MKVDNSKSRIIFFTGPTGAGKTKLINYISGKYNSPVINMDSMQSYDFFEVGTGRIDLDTERRYLYGYKDPREEKNGEEHVNLAKDLIADLAKSNKIILLDGASTTYIPLLLKDVELEIIAIKFKDESKISEKMRLRTKCFLDEGIVEEVKNAIEKGLSDSYILKHENLVYLPVIQYINQQISEEDLITEIAANMLKYHMYQLDFLDKLEGIKWFYNDDGYEKEIEEYLFPD